MGSAASAYWSYKTATVEKVEVLSRDCIFAEELALNDAAVDALDRQSLEDLAAHNRSVRKQCQDSDR